MIALKRRANGVNPVYYLWEYNCAECGADSFITSFRYYACFKCRKPTPPIIELVDQQIERIKYHYKKK